MNKKHPVLSVIATVMLFAASSCGKKDADADELAQNMGDQMASVDEGGGSSSGAYSFNQALGARQTFARRLPNEVQGSWFERNVLPSAEAVTCLADAANQFTSCGGTNTITRNFGGCTVGSATITGSVVFTWTNGGLNNCTMPSANHSVSRRPSFTVTGRRGGTFTVSTTGTNGQTLTKVSTVGTSYNFSNDGIRRVLADSSGATLLDFTTTTTSNITISGTSRSGRTMTGGTLHVVNNLTEVSCDFSPSNLTWTSTCNCATSGSWTGTCSDGKTATYTISGCGTGSLDVGGTATDVTLDRCYGT